MVWPGLGCENRVRQVYSGVKSNPRTSVYSGLDFAGSTFFVLHLYARLTRRQSTAVTPGPARIESKTSAVRSISR